MALAAAMAMRSEGLIRLRFYRRSVACHVRQIAMYVCHVALRVPMQSVGFLFSRDRSTVSHACHVVEDQRDDPVFDSFVQAVEHAVEAIFLQEGGSRQ